ncbi:hypothetical protein DSO57_1006180 [Entomophthora muscae]|uniref:Uncharacterized protein n=1 Tax=Entomophthora muscae TaxID=34485 RepID=A0ACC2RMG7_9FUNG|nr:hypothetical protein DSO57_1006180 [Entomophthora muscae]
MSTHLMQPTVKPSNQYLKEKPSTPAGRNNYQAITFNNLVLNQLEGLAAASCILQACLQQSNQNDKVAKQVMVTNTPPNTPHIIPLYHPISQYLVRSTVFWIPIAEGREFDSNIQVKDGTKS